MRGKSAAVALVLVGCTDGGADTGAEGCFANDPTLTIGTGAYDWQDLAPGDPLTMVHGPQGGWHLLGSARIGNTTEIVEVHYTVTARGDTIVSDNLYRVALFPEGECEGSYTGMYGYLDVSALAEGDLDTPPELLSYETLTLRMEVTDEDGRTAEASLDVKAEPDPEDLDMVPE